MKVDPIEDVRPHMPSKEKATMPKSTPEMAIPAKQAIKKIPKPKGIPAFKEESGDTVKDIESDILDEGDLEEASESSRPLSSTSEPKSTSTETESMKTQEDSISSVTKQKTKPEEKMTMDEKIAAEKAKKDIKAEEPVFSGMKLKKSKPLQRQWTEEELPVVELTAHKFEQLPQIETVNTKF